MLLLLLYMSLCDIIPAPQMVPVASESDLDLLKGRIVSLKAEIRKEQGTTGQGSGPDESPATKVRKYTEITVKVPFVCRII